MAAARHGHVTILHVAPSGRRPEWLVPPETCEGVPVRVIVRPGSNPAHEILEAVRTDPPELLLLAWRGEPGRGRVLLGRNLDTLVQFAPCDVVVIRCSPDKPSLEGPPEAIGRVLVPAAGGPNAKLAFDLALALSPEDISRVVMAALVLCYVICLWLLRSRFGRVTLQVIIEEGVQSQGREGENVLFTFFPNRRFVEMPGLSMVCTSFVRLPEALEP